MGAICYKLGYFVQRAEHTCPNRPAGWLLTQSAEKSGIALQAVLWVCYERLFTVLATREGALEVLNDGFLKVFTRLDQYDSAQPFKGWLRRILINAAIDHYRQEVRHHHHEDIEQVEQSVASESADAFGQLAHEDLMSLIQRLSPAYRLVFNLYVMDGFTHEEIAGQLGISVGASKSNLARARENLRTLLKRLNNDEYVRANR